MFHLEKGLIMHTSMKGNQMFYVTTIVAPKDPMCMQTKTASEKEIHL